MPRPPFVNGRVASSVALRPVVEAPVVVHARLEAGRVELLGLERGMPSVTQEERELLAEGLDLPRTRTGGRSLLTQVLLEHRRHLLELLARERHVVRQALVLRVERRVPRDPP